MAPRVSVGLPVFNGERYLEQALDDLLGGTFEDLELVAVDNASTDATADILADTARRDRRVRVARNATNIGALPNANRAVAMARAPLFALAAYDDRRAPTFLERLVGTLDRAPDAVLAYGASTLIGEDDRPFAFDAARRRYRDAAGQVYDYDAALERDLPAGTGGRAALARYHAALHARDINAPIHGVFRRAALDRVGPHRLYGSDRKIVAHAALLGPFAFVPEALFGYRIHAASTFHLTRAEWLAREAGRAAVGSALDGVRTLAAYLGATAQADLGRAARVGAVAASLGSAARPAVLKRIVLPGPDNYFGWTTWPGHTPAPPSQMHALPDDLGVWNWLKGGERVNKMTDGTSMGAERASDRTLIQS